MFYTVLSQNAKIQHFLSQNVKIRHFLLCKSWFHIDIIRQKIDIKLTCLNFGRHYLSNSEISLNLKGFYLSMGGASRFQKTVYYAFPKCPIPDHFGHFGPEFGILLVLLHINIFLTNCLCSLIGSITCTKFDEFSENFQTASDPTPPSEVFRKFTECSPGSLP